MGGLTVVLEGNLAFYGIVGSQMLRIHLLKRVGQPILLKFIYNQHIHQEFSDPHNLNDSLGGSIIVTVDA